MSTNSIAQESRGELFDAMLSLCGEFDERSYGGVFTFEHGPFIFSMNDIGNVTVRGENYFVEFLTEDGDSWIEHAGLDESIRADVIHYIGDMCVGEA